MNRKKYVNVITRLSLIAHVCLPSIIFAQGIAISTWRDHLSYANGLRVAEGGGKVYCITNGRGIFSYSKNDHSVQRFSKITGFSDVGATAIGYNSYNDIVVIAYENANIDLLTGNQIINLPHIKNFSITGSKKINNVIFLRDSAFLSCGFGIVVLDLKKKEIRDTYFIESLPLNINEIAFSSDTIYAASNKGIYKAALKNPNLADHTNWERFNNLPGTHSGKPFNTLAYFNGKLYANANLNPDSILIYDNVKWKTDPNSPSQIEDLEASNNKLLRVLYGFVEIMDAGGSIEDTIWGTFPTRHAVLDEDGVCWIAASGDGLEKKSPGISEAIYPTGPSVSEIFDLEVQGGIIWCVQGGMDGAWGNLYKVAILNRYAGGEWKAISDDTLEPIRDFVDVAVNPNNLGQTYVASWGGGLYEFENETFLNRYTKVNSTLRPLISDVNTYRIGGVSVDPYSNLWVTNTGVDSFLSVKRSNGKWHAFDFGEIYTTEAYASKVMITSLGQKWIIMRDNGIIVFHEKGSFDNTGDDRKRHLRTGLGKGNLPSNIIFSFAEDLDGEIWVGTSEGVAVFYSPDLIFEENENSDAQEILIEYEGQAQILLKTEGVSCIAIDGANRKWVGTQNAGVFMLSDDGQEEIVHFTVQNSPLFSNLITSIAIDHQSGEIFIGTDKGLISYRGTATEGGFFFGEVYAYPNPVRENYQGPVAIKGLARDADVKITDITGNLIYATRAEGGQAVWDGKNHEGKRAHTGVYLVFCSNEDGSETHVAKILFIN